MSLIRENFFKYLGLYRQILERVCRPQIFMCCAYIHELALQADWTQCYFFSFFLPPSLSLSLPASFPPFFLPPSFFCPSFLPLFLSSSSSFFFFPAFRAESAAHGSSQKESNWSCSCPLTPEPQQRQIQSVSSIYTTVHSNPDP